MENKNYSFAGISFAVQSDIEIENGRFYAPFYTDGGAADYYITVREGRLPERRGNVIYDKKTAALIDNDGEKLMFSAYPDSASKEYKDYACLKKNGNELLLTVENPQGFRDTVLFKAINIPALLLENGVALFHSSFIITDDGKAVIFTGKSGVGKTTQAKLWEKHRGALVVNGDRSALTVRNGVLTACGAPFCGSSDIALNKEAPVKAIVSLFQKEKNKAFKTDTVHGFLDVLGGISYEQGDADETRLAVSAAEKIASCGMNYSLKCRPDEGAVETLEKIIRG